MKVLHVTNRYFPELQYGGPPERIHALCVRLAARGCQSDVLTRHSRLPGGHAQVNYEGVMVHYLSYWRLASREIPLPRNEIARRVQAADLVHIYGLYDLQGIMAAWLAASRQRPFVLEPMGMFLPIVRSIRKKQLYHATVGQWMIRRAARIIATSEQEQAEIVSTGVDRDQVVVRRNGVDLEQFAVLPERSLARHRFGVDDTSFVFLYLSRLSVKKNPEMLLRAFAQLGQPQARLLFVGPEEKEGYTDSLIQLAGELGIRSQMHFAGPLYGAEKQAAFAAADVFVLPSSNENFGNVIAEAIAAQVPVIITNRCGIAPFVLDRAGLVIDCDESQLVDAMRALVDNTDLRLSFRAAAPQVAAELSWDHAVDKTVSIYQEILAGQTFLQDKGFALE